MSIWLGLTESSLSCVADSLMQRRMRTGEVTIIAKESSLLVASKQYFRANFAIDARTNCEAISISPKKKTVDLRNVLIGRQM